MAPLSLRRKKKSSSTSKTPVSSDLVQNLPTVDEVSNGGESPTTQSSVGFSAPDSNDCDHSISLQENSQPLKKRPTSKRTTSSHRIFSNSSSTKSIQSCESNSALSSFGESLVNTFSFSSSQNKTNNAPSNNNPQPTPLSSNRFTSIFKKSQPAARPVTPQLLSPSVNTHESPLSTVNESPIKRMSKWKLSRSRGGSISSLNRVSHNNNSAVLLFENSQLKSNEDLHRTNSVSSHQSHPYMSFSSPASVRALGKSSSLRSLVDFTKPKSSKSSKSSDSENDSTAKRSSDSFGVKSILSDAPVMLPPSSGETNNASTLSGKVTFEIPNFTVTQADDSSDDVIPFPNKQVEKKPSFFSSFANLLEANHDSASMKRSSSAQSLHNLPHTQRSKPSLLKLKNKTVSKLFFNDNDSKPELHIDLPPSRSGSISNSSSPVSPHSINLTASNTETPFPLLRTYSSQMDANTKEFNDSDTTPPKLLSARPRSHTLSSLEQKGNTFSKPPKIGFFSNRRSDSDATSNNPTISPSAGHFSVRASSPCPSIDLSLPERAQDDTPVTYLQRIIEKRLGGYAAGELSKQEDSFHREVLKLYLELFNFTDDPLDMALRKFLVSVHLPKETQQIDRVVEAFAFRYYQCNPDIYSSAENTYVIVFSLMLLHTDFFNKNNKFKMQKTDYFRMTEDSGVSKDILGCFYDNITYTPFIHTDEDVILPGQITRAMPPRRSSTFGRNSKDLTDPYTLMLEGRLSSIRPDLSCLSFEDPYVFAPVDKETFLSLRKEFDDGQSLQLISQRSRPGAFLSPDSLDDPNSSGPGVVEIKVVKAGFLYKAEGKRKNIWREWGIILTASQLYFFKDTAWFKNNIMNQQQSSFFSGRKKRAKTAPVPSEVDSDDGETQTIIRPMVDGFHPHTVIPTTEIAALFSTDEAPKNKSCFLLSYKSGDFEWFSSNSETELNDWGLKINFAASFNTYYVVGISSSLRKLTPKLRTLKRNNSDSSTSTRLSGTTTASINNKQQECSEVHQARKLNVEHKLSLIETKIDEIQEQLNEHIRTRKGLQLLAPIQLKTREAVFSCAANLTAALKWKWLQRRKMLCYKQYFELDLEVEKELCSMLKPADMSSSLAIGGADEVDDKTSIESKESTNTSNLHEATVPITHDQESLTSPTTSDTLSSNKSVISFSVKSVVSSESGETTTPKLVVAKHSRVHYHSRSLSQGTVSPPSRSVSHRRSQSQLIPKRSAENHSGDDVNISNKRMPLTLRSSSISRRKSQTLSNAGNSKVTTQRSTSLIRNKGDNITLMGKKFHVVEVNPEFGTNKQSKSIDDNAKIDSLKASSSVDEDLNVAAKNSAAFDQAKETEKTHTKTAAETTSRSAEAEVPQKLLHAEVSEESFGNKAAKNLVNIAGDSAGLSNVEQISKTSICNVVDDRDKLKSFQPRPSNVTSTFYEETATESFDSDAPVTVTATEIIETGKKNADMLTESVKSAELSLLDEAPIDEFTDNDKSVSKVLSLTKHESEETPKPEDRSDTEEIPEAKDESDVKEKSDVKENTVSVQENLATGINLDKDTVTEEAEAKVTEGSGDDKEQGNFALELTTASESVDAMGKELDFNTVKPHENDASENVEPKKAPKFELPEDDNIIEINSTKCSDTTDKLEAPIKLDQSNVADKTDDVETAAPLNDKAAVPVKSKPRHHSRRSKRKGSRRAGKSTH